MTTPAPPLSARKILLGICGSIAAYKAVYLTRMLIREGAEVRVIMTQSAQSFVAPLTFSTLTRHPVMDRLMDGNEWQNHVAIGMWADLMIIVPATAHTLSGMASGRCDSLLLAVYLSAKCPVWVAPSMDLDMWRHPTTLRTLAYLRKDGVRILHVGEGELASGLFGPGRVAEPEEILAEVISHFKEELTLAGKIIMITAGPTREPLDPVRFISNHSTGKMGAAIAHVLARRGATIHHIMGPGAIEPAHPHIQVHNVTTAQEMMVAASSVFEACHAAIFAAAVADYRPETVAQGKIKKKDDKMSISLVRNPDIAATLGHRKRKDQVLIGFALETDMEVEHAREKLTSKNLDAIVLNSLRDEGAGFGSDTNKVSILRATDNKINAFGLKHKNEVAIDIADELQQLLALKD